MAMELKISAGEMVSPSAERTRALNVFCESKTAVYQVILPYGWGRTLRIVPMIYQKNSSPYVMGTDGASDRVFDRINEFCHGQAKHIKTFLYSEEEALRRASYWLLKSAAFNESQGGSR